MILIYVIIAITLIMCVFGVIENIRGNLDNGSSVDINRTYNDIIKFKLDENITSLFNYHDNYERLRVIYRSNGRHRYSIRNIAISSMSGSKPVMLVYERMMVNVVGTSLVFHYIVDNVNTHIIAKLDVSIFEDMRMNDYIHMRCNDSIDIVGMLQLKPVVYNFDVGVLKTTSLGYALTGKKELNCRIGYLDGLYYHKGKVVDESMVVI